MQSFTFDPNVWKDEKANSSFDVPQSFHVRLEAPGALFMHIGGKKKLIGHGTEFKIDGPAESFKVSASVPCSVYIAPQRVAVGAKEVYTNIDKTTYSAAEELVLRSIREQQLRTLEAKRAERRASLEQQKLRIQQGKQDELSESAKRAEKEVEKEDKQKEIEERELAESAA
jgi:hypothetical protein